MKKLTMGLKTYNEIKTVHRKYQKQEFPSTKECTFNPKTNSRGKKRPFEKFIKTQHNFLDQRQNKIEKLKTQIDECINT